jgi:hypothetical protein
LITCMATLRHGCDRKANSPHLRAIPSMQLSSL